MADRHEEYVRVVRQNTIQLWQSYQAIRSLKDEWNAQDYGNTLEIDPAGNNADVTVADVGAVIHATSDAIAALMAQGHATNITNLLE